MVRKSKKKWCGGFKKKPGSGAICGFITFISTIVVYQQIQHKGTRYRYDTENLIKMPVNGDVVDELNPIQRHDCFRLVENVKA
jgi:hypothetical protein